MIKLPVEITSVRVYDGLDEDRRPEKKAECLFTQISDEESQYKCRGKVTVSGEAALAVKEGDKGTVKVKIGRRDVNRKDGTGTFVVMDTIVWGFEKEG